MGSFVHNSRKASTLRGFTEPEVGPTRTTSQALLLSVLAIGVTVAGYFVAIWLATTAALPAID